MPTTSAVMMDNGPEDPLCRPITRFGYANSAWKCPSTARRTAAGQAWPPGRARPRRTALDRARPLGQVKRAVPDPGRERAPLASGEDQRGPAPVLGVTHRDQGLL